MYFPSFNGSLPFTFTNIFSSNITHETEDIDLFFFPTISRTVTHSHSVSAVATWLQKSFTPFCAISFLSTQTLKCCLSISTSDIFTWAVLSDSNCAQMHHEHTNKYNWQHRNTCVFWCTFRLCGPSSRIEAPST